MKVTVAVQDSQTSETVAWEVLTVAKSAFDTKEAYFDSFRKRTLAGFAPREQRRYRFYWLREGGRPFCSEVELINKQRRAYRSVMGSRHPAAVEVFPNYEETIQEERIAQRGDFPRPPAGEHASFDDGGIDDEAIGRAGPKVAVALRAAERLAFHASTQRSLLTALKELIEGTGTNAGTPRPGCLLDDSAERVAIVIYDAVLVLWLESRRAVDLPTDMKIDHVERLSDSTYRREVNEFVPFYLRLLEDLPASGNEVP